MSDQLRSEGNPPRPRRRSFSSLLASIWPPLPIWRRLDIAIAASAAYTAIVVLVVAETGFKLPDWSGGSTILNGIVLGLLLGFRTQAAYDRWWEGRRLWGQLINDTRSLCTKAAAMRGLSDGARAELAHLLPAFARALKDRLRAAPVDPRIIGPEKPLAKAVHLPLLLFNQLLAVLQEERTAGRVSELDLLLLDPHARSLMDVCGGCERIKNTPVPLSYQALLRHGMVFYLLSTPWLVADHLLWWAVPVMALLGYFMLGMELTAEDVEEPFGHDADDLTLSAYCETIQQSVEQVLGNFINRNLQ